METRFSDNLAGTGLGGGIAAVPNCVGVVIEVNPKYGTSFREI